MSLDKSSMGVFERHLTSWVALCIIGGIALGKLAPNLAQTLDGMAIHVNGAPVVSIPIAVCLFFMMYPIMVKIDFGEVVQASRSPKPVLLTLAVNWLIKPFTMLAIATLFLGVLFKGFLPGSEIVKGGAEVELYRSYISGAILLGIAPCTAMVLVWGYLARGNQGLTLVMVAINSLTMLLLYGLLGGWLLGVNRMPVPWQALLLSVVIYVALPLVAGYLSRRWIMKTKGQKWFNEKFLHFLTPVSITALLATLVLLFSFKGETILANPFTILWIAIPLALQTLLIFALTYVAAKLLNFSYEDAAPSALIGASNHFEVAIATAVMLFGLSSGAALATVVGVLIEVPLMLFLVRVCQNTRGWFDPSKSGGCKKSENEVLRS
ncbi:MAG TPA: ACR3 family arsenite efflux transporter [Verrucomicrobiales bacterium]|nr:ACR3 family arsenite efflux transporter [Verrucomicrobiales bacterium]